MKKNSLLTIAVLTTVIQSLACLNGDSKILSDGTNVYQHHYSDKVHSLIFYPAEYDKAYRQLDSLYRLTKKIEYLSDKGVILILRGRYKEAIQFYLEIEKMQPNRYSTASNIGTAYELNGQAEEALKWIKKAYQLNPSSHYGSEWLHVKILEAKTKGEPYITDKFLINTSFGLGDEPVTEFEELKLLALEDALIFQLSERISFVKPKDKIVGRLFFELANIYYIEGRFDRAVNTYKQAEDYGFTDPLLQLRVNKALENVRHSNEKISMKEILYWSFGSLLVIALTAFFVIKRNFRRRLFS